MQRIKNKNIKNIINQKFLHDLKQNQLRTNLAKDLLPSSTEESKFVLIHSLFYFFFFGKFRLYICINTFLIKFNLRFGFSEFWFFYTRFSLQKIKSIIYLVVFAFISIYRVFIVFFVGFFNYICVFCLDGLFNETT